MDSLPKVQNNSRLDSASTVAAEESQLPIDLFEEKDTFHYSYQGQQSTYSYQHDVEEKKFFTVFSQGRYLFLDTQEKLMDYLETFMQSMGNGPSMRQFRPQLAFYHFRPDSFLYMLAENCTLLLEKSLCQAWLERSTIYTALMMMEVERYELKACTKKVNTSRLLQN